MKDATDEHGPIVNIVNTYNQFITIVEDFKF